MQKLWCVEIIIFLNTIAIWWVYSLCSVCSFLAPLQITVAVFPCTGCLTVGLDGCQFGTPLTVFELGSSSPRIIYDQKLILRIFDFWSRLGLMAPKGIKRALLTQMTIQRSSAQSITDQPESEMGYFKQILWT